MTFASLLRLAAAAFLCAMGVAPAVAADIEAGQRLTQQWCTGCHVVGNGTRGTDSAPSLPVIAQRAGQDRAWLKAWLTAPHPPMPNLSLSRQEIDNITAYLDSLAKH